jgi:hypothetical protein
MGEGSRMSRLPKSLPWNCDKGVDQLPPRVAATNTPTKPPTPPGSTFYPFAREGSK